MNDPTELRQHIMQFLQGADALDSAHIVIGMGMVVEFLDETGERHLFKMTSDASGRPMPWYMDEAYGHFLMDADEEAQGAEEE